MWCIMTDQASSVVMSRVTNILMKLNMGLSQDVTPYFSADKR